MGGREKSSPLEALVGQPAEKAVPRMVELLGGKMFAFSLKFCGNSEDAEDLVQETFLQAYLKWGQFEGRSALSSWLFRIAARGCQRMNRRRSGQPPRFESLSDQLASGTTLAAELPSAGDDPLDTEVRRETIETVDRALARLPVKYRLPLVLKEIGELSLQEIAAILGIKESTAKTRVHRGRLALRTALEESLGRTSAARGDHPQQVCLDLLHAKMDALDQGTAFPVDEELLCTRCKEFVASLDMTVEACRWIRGGDLPEGLRTRLVAELGGAAG